MNYRNLGVLIGLVVSGLLLTGCASKSTGGYTRSDIHRGEHHPGRLEQKKIDRTVFERIPFANDRQTQNFRKSRSVTYNRSTRSTAPKQYQFKDQQEIGVLEGNPDFTRQFYNHYGEKIDEWLYMEKDYQIQFKEGVLVYFAPMDEQAKQVLQHGQPTKITVQRMYNGEQKEFFWYRGQWRMMAFSNGKKIVIQ